MKNTKYFIIISMLLIGSAIHGSQRRRLRSRGQLGSQQKITRLIAQINRAMRDKKYDEVDRLIKEAGQDDSIRAADVRSIRTSLNAEITRLRSRGLTTRDAQNLNQVQQRAQNTEQKKIAEESEIKEVGTGELFPDTPVTTQEKKPMAYVLTPQEEEVVIRLINEILKSDEKTVQQVLSSHPIALTNLTIDNKKHLEEFKNIIQTKSSFFTLPGMVDFNIMNELNTRLKMIKGSTKFEQLLKTLDADPSQPEANVDDQSKLREQLQNNINIINQNSMVKDLIIKLDVVNPDFFNSIPENLSTSEIEKANFWLEQRFLELQNSSDGLYFLKLVNDIVSNREPYAKYQTDTNRISDYDVSNNTDLLSLMNAAAVSKNNLTSYTEQIENFIENVELLKDFYETDSTEYFEDGDPTNKRILVRIPQYLKYLELYSNDLKDNVAVIDMIAQHKEILGTNILAPDTINIVYQGINLDKDLFRRYNSLTTLYSTIQKIIAYAVNNGIIPPIPVINNFDKKMSEIEQTEKLQTTGQTEQLKAAEQIYTKSISLSEDDQKIAKNLIADAKSIILSIDDIHNQEDPKLMTRALDFKNKHTELFIQEGIWDQKRLPFTTEFNTLLVQVENGNINLNKFKQWINNLNKYKQAILEEIPELEPTPPQQMKTEIQEIMTNTIYDAFFQKPHVTVLQDSLGTASIDRAKLDTLEKGNQQIIISYIKGNTDTYKGVLPLENEILTNLNRLANQKTPYLTKYINSQTGKEFFLGLINKPITNITAVTIKNAKTELSKHNISRNDLEKYSKDLKKVVLKNEIVKLLENSSNLTQYPMPKQNELKKYLSEGPKLLASYEQNQTIQPKEMNQIITELMKDRRDIENLTIIISELKSKSLLDLPQ